MKTIAIVAALGFAVIGAPGAHAAGCLSGAAVGGVAGHVAGHHGLLGAAAGCAVGHHMANKHEREDQARYNNTGSQYDNAGRQ
jgi:outer membrane lipoprotein SlyB